MPLGRIQLSCCPYRENLLVSGLHCFIVPLAVLQPPVEGLPHDCAAVEGPWKAA